MSLRPSPAAGARHATLAGLALLWTLSTHLIATPTSARIVLPEVHDHVTVLLADGWRLADATVHWSERDGGLAVARTADRAERIYAPGQIQALLDVSGQDITGRILPAWVLPRLAGAHPPAVTPPGAPGPPRDPGAAAVPADPAAPRAGSQVPHWSFLFGFAAGYSRALEDDLQGAGGGPGFDAQARLRLLGPFYLTGGYGWQELARGTPVPGAPQDEPGDAPDLRLGGAWAGLALLPSSPRPTTARVYLEGGLGRYEVEHVVVASADEAFLGYTAGMGLLVPVGDAAVVDVGARALHLVNLDLGTDSDRHTILGFRVGINLLGQ